MTTNSNDQMRINTYNGTNWDTYRAKTYAYARMNGLAEILDGTLTIATINTETDAQEKIKKLADYSTKEAILSYYLIQTQSETTLRQISDLVEKGTAREIWKRLSSRFESNTKSGLRINLQTLIEFKQNGKPISEYVAAAKLLKQRIESATDLLDQLTINTLINGLDEKFWPLKHTLLSAEHLKLEDCCIRILEHGGCIEQQKVTTALNTIFNGKGGKSAKGGQQKCPTCKKGGHTTERCWVAHPELRPEWATKKSNGRSTDNPAGKTAGSTASTAKLAQAETNANADDANAWVARANHTFGHDVPKGFLRFWSDSGANEHFSTCIHGLENLTSNSIEVTVADGRRVSSEGTGDIGDKLKNVHVIGGFDANLMSVSQHYKDGYATIYSPHLNGFIVVKAENFHYTIDGKPFLQGKYDANSGLFYTDIQVNPKSARLAGSRRVDTIKREGKAALWFRRFGYQNPVRIVQALQNDLVKGLNLPGDIRTDEFGADSCDAYHRGRSKAHAHYNRLGEKRATKPFEFIYLDLKVVGVDDYHDNKYACIILDDYTRWKAVILLKRKSDLTDELRRWHQQDVVSRGYSVRRIRLDNAGEQKSFEFDSFLTDIAARAEYTNAYSSAANTAERTIQTLWNTEQCLRFGGNFPKSAWGELLLTAAYLENMMPTSANPDKKTPWEMLYGNPPNVSGLRVIGAAAYVHIHKPLRAALDPKAEVGRLIGYARGTNGYRILMDSRTGKIVETAHVTFAEKPSVSPEVVVSMPGPNAEHRFYIPNSFLTVPEQRKVDGIITPAPTGFVDDEVANADVDPNPPIILEVPADNNHDDQDHIVVPNDLLQVLNPELIPTDAIRRSTRETQPIERLTFPAGQIRPYRKPSAKLSVAGNTQLDMSRRVSTLALAVKIKDKDAFQDPRLRKSMLKELVHLFSTNAVKIVPLPEGHKAIGNVWAHKHKYDVDGNFQRVKSRVCPWGFDQVPGVSYDPTKTEAPTLRMETIMLVLSLTVQRGMHSRNVDVDSAFQIPKNPFPTYMKAPKGITLPKGYALQLVNSINGTKQAAYVWNEMIDSIIIDMGFKKCLLDSCLYVKWENDELTLIALYVDDLRIVSDNPSSLDIIEKGLRGKLPIKLVPENQWLGMKIEHEKEKGLLKVSQEKYIKDLLKTFGMENSTPVSTPAKPNSKLLKPSSPQLSHDSNSFNMAEFVGNCLWLGRTSRPDILYAVGQLGQHVSNYDDSHIDAAKWLLRYLYGTSSLCMTLRQQSSFIYEGICDSDFAGEPEQNEGSMKSLAGMIGMIRGIGPVYAQSKLQSTVSTSTAEAELKAVGGAVQHALGFRQLLEEIGFSPELPTIIYNDNMSCIASLKTKLSGSKLRHVKVNFQFVKECISNKQVDVVYCPTTENIADILTKSLPKPRFEYLRDRLMDNGRLYKSQNPTDNPGNNPNCNPRRDSKISPTKDDPSASPDANPGSRN
jgi:hypothetical protein